MSIRRRKYRERCHYCDRIKDSWELTDGICDWCQPDEEEQYSSAEEAQEAWDDYRDSMAD